MWVVLLRVEIEGIKRFKLFLPIPLFSILELADMLDDAACFFRLLDRRTGRGAAFMLSAAAGAAKEILLDLMCHTGCMDLADVGIDDGKTQIRVKCMLR